MQNLFKELFEYNHYSNQQLADTISTKADSMSGKVLDLYSHILNAHQIWNSRIKEETPAVGVWEVRTPLHFKNIDKANFEQTLSIIDQFELDSRITHIKVKGRPLDKKIWEILFHVINHSTYHRAQIATEFRKNGLPPLMTDYIFYDKGDADSH